MKLTVSNAYWYVFNNGWPVKLGSHPFMKTSTVTSWLPISRKMVRPSIVYGPVDSRGIRATPKKHSSAMPSMFESVNRPFAMSHWSGTPLESQSHDAVKNRSHRSVLPLPSQSEVPPGSHSSGIPLALQSAEPNTMSQLSARKFPLQSGSHSSGIPLASQSRLPPGPKSQSSGMPLPLQSMGSQLSGMPFVLQSLLKPETISSPSSIPLPLQSPNAAATLRTAGAVMSPSKPLTRLAVPITRCLTACQPMPGFWLMTNPATPTTCGVAIDVPLKNP